MHDKAGHLTATVKNTKAEGAGEFEAIISTENLDRDGEILDKGAFDPLPDEIPIHVDHQFFDISKVVGRGVPYYDGDLLKVKARYASTDSAQLVRTLVAEGMVTTMSVGYLNADYEDKDGTPHLRSADLIEASFVSVPANTEALVTAAKALGAKVGARNNAGDGDRLQQIHDLSVANGADCETKGADLFAAFGKAATKGLTKTIAGTVEETQENLRESLRTLHPDAQWLWIRGTFPDRVVYEAENEGEGSVTYQADYETSDDGFTFGDPVEVELEEIVTPAEGETEETTPETPDEEPAKAASASGPSPAVAKAQAIAAEAELLFID